MTSSVDKRQEASSKVKGRKTGKYKLGRLDVIARPIFRITSLLREEHDSETQRTFRKAKTRLVDPAKGTTMKNLLRSRPS